MYTICWTDTGTEKWERCSSLCETAKLLLREGITNDENVLIFPPEAGKHTETSIQIMEQFQRQQMNQLKSQAIKRLLMNGKIEFEYTGSEASHDCVVLRSPLIMEKQHVCYIPKMSWENIEDHLAEQIQRLIEEGRIHWNACHDRDEAKLRNPDIIDKIIADLSMKCYLSAKKANKGRQPQSYSLSQEAIIAIITKQNYLDGLISEEEYKAYCKVLENQKEKDG